jgi:hypothetical protein
MYVYVLSVPYAIFRRQSHEKPQRSLAEVNGGWETEPFAQDRLGNNVLGPSYYI